MMQGVYLVVEYLQAICSSLVLISCFYLLVNYFYFSILGVEGILHSSAVATDYAKAIAPQISWIIPIMVACSCLGAALVQVCSGSEKYYSRLICCGYQGMTAARIPYAAARNEQMPKFLSMIHLNFLTPAPAVILNGLLGNGPIINIQNNFKFKLLLN